MKIKIGDTIMPHESACGVYRAVWPIIDPDRPRKALVAEAVAELAEMAEADNVVITGPVTCDTTRLGTDVPGWERWHGYVLIAQAPARTRPEANPDEPDPVDGEEACDDSLIDWMAVEIALSGERHVELTKAEKAAAVRIGKQSMSTREVAERLGTTDRTVLRIAKADREALAVAA